MMMITIITVDGGSDDDDNINKILLIRPMSNTANYAHMTHKLVHSKKELHQFHKKNKID